MCRSNPPELRVYDGHRPSRRHLARHFALPQPLLEGVTLVVAIIETRDGRVSPVDDLHAATRFYVSALADEDVPAPPVLQQAEVPEIGRPSVHGNAFATAALARQRLDSMHLFQQWTLILGFGLGQGIAQLDERGRVVDGRTRALRWRIDLGQHHAKKGLLFGDNRRRADTGLCGCWFGAALVVFVLHDKVV